MQSKLRILAIRLGAMGDVIHALPAAATLKHNFPQSHLTWIIHKKWTSLLEGNPFVDEVIAYDRSKVSNLVAVYKQLRAKHYDVAVDFQGLIQSALIALATRPERIFGFHRSQVKEKPAALFYSHEVSTQAAHVVDKNLELAAAAGAPAILTAFPLPDGAPEGELPQGPFVLACPLAGWASKQWPLEYYAKLASLLKRETGLPLVLNGPPNAVGTLGAVADAVVNLSGLPGLIHATRRAAAVIGVDSGPLHMAAAMRRPGVAIFGPTDPARNGPYGDCFTTLRQGGAATTYKRHNEISESMKAITPDQVFAALRARLVAVA